MTLRYMKIFVSVYEHNSITKAADVLHLAQPSVSLAIKEMEEYYGTRFFERIGRHISPTGAGNELLQICTAYYRVVLMKWNRKLKIGIIAEHSVSVQALRLALIFSR